LYDKNTIAEKCETGSMAITYDLESAMAESAEFLRASFEAQANNRLVCSTEYLRMSHFNLIQLGKFFDTAYVAKEEGKSITTDGNVISHENIYLAENLLHDGASSSSDDDEGLTYNKRNIRDLSSELLRSEILLGDNDGGNNEGETMKLKKMMVVLAKAMRKCQHDQRERRMHRKTERKNRVRLTSDVPWTTAEVDRCWKYVKKYGADKVAGERAKRACQKRNTRAMDPLK
jgi:hypothetical protein